MKSAIVILIIGPIFAVAGYFVAFHVGKPILDNAKASVDWPTTPGVIERSEVVTSKNNDNQTMYEPEVAYSYSVDGKDYEGNTVGFGAKFSSSSRGFADDVVGKYPKGKDVSVHFRPEQPGDSVLEPGVTWMSYVPYAIGLLFLGIGLLFVGGLVLKVLFATFLVAGAATGTIGRGSIDDEFERMARGKDERNDTPPRRKDDDDGFHVG